jgi:hypothetical protein
MVDSTCQNIELLRIYKLYEKNVSMYGIFDDIEVEFFCRLFNVPVIIETI